MITGSTQTAVLDLLDVVRHENRHDRLHLVRACKPPRGESVKLLKLFYAARYFELHRKHLLHFIGQNF